MWSIFHMYDNSSSKCAIILSFIFKIEFVLHADCGKKTSFEELIDFIMYCDCGISIFESKVVSLMQEN
jgi:hypothetical protein